MTIPAYPLQWPAGWKRTPAAARMAAKFSRKEKNYRTWTDGNGNKHSSAYTQTKDLTIAEGATRVRDSIKRMGVHDDDLVISTNLELRLDGFPRSGQREPADPGVAIYWRDGGETRCMAIDQYDRCADNLAAIAATLEAMRAIERHGGAEILNRAFAGFAALPPPSDANAPKPWWEVLGVSREASPDEVTAAYRRQRSLYHPDRGGSDEAFGEVQQAYAQAMHHAGRQA